MKKVILGLMTSLMIGVAANAIYIERDFRKLIEIENSKSRIFEITKYNVWKVLDKYSVNRLEEIKNNRLTYFLANKVDGNKSAQSLVVFGTDFVSKIRLKSNIYDLEEYSGEILKYDTTCSFGVTDGSDCYYMVYLDGNIKYNEAWEPEISVDGLNANKLVSDGKSSTSFVNINKYEITKEEENEFKRIDKINNMVDSELYKFREIQESLDKNISKLENKKYIKYNPEDSSELQSIILKEENGDISLLTTNTKKEDKDIKEVIESFGKERNIEYNSECSKEVKDGSDCYYKIRLRSLEKQIEITKLKEQKELDDKYKFVN